ncbi:MAG: TrkA family potassium uptake protein [Deltaproteobacteria bacterium]|nr:TrkA family potassium uptake protein [Deltaproteobacteria bacterium]
MTQFAVVGLGKFGMALAEELTRLGQGVIAVDANPEKTRDAQALVRQAFTADATQRPALVSMELGKVDVAVVSLGQRMDWAALAVLHLSELGVPQIVAKALNEEHAAMLTRLGASHVVFPEKEMAYRVAEQLGSRHILSYLPLDADFAILELATPAAWIGRSLAALDPGRAFGIQVLAVRELLPERTIVPPGGDLVLKDSDVLVVLGPEKMLSRVRRLDAQRRQFAVIGLGRFGYYMVRSLSDMGHDVLALDDRKDNVEQIAPFCSQALVADATDQSEIEDTGAFEAQVGIVAIGDRIDASILATLYLKEAGVREIIAKAGSPAHARILARIGASDVVHPERDAALLTAQRLAAPTVLERLPFLEGYAISETPAPRALWGVSLSRTHLRSAHNVSVILIKRRVAGEDLTLPARPDEVFREGDKLLVLVRPNDLEAFRKAYPE